MKDTFVRQSTMVTLVGVIISLVACLFWWNRLPPQLPWLYSLVWGDGMLVEKFWWVTSLVAPVALTIFDLVLANKLIDRDVIVARTVVGFGTLAALLYLLSFWRVLLIFK